MPLGPDEESAQWRAQARLGVSNMCCYVWSEFKPHGRYYHFFSRVTEKTAIYAKAVMDRAFTLANADGFFNGVDSICLVSDTGNHYRSRIFLEPSLANGPSAGARESQYCTAPKHI